MTQKTEEKSKANSWYEKCFFDLLSLESLTQSFAYTQASKSNRIRSKSLSSRLELDNFPYEFNLASTNQTSVEISIDEICSPKNEKKIEIDDNFFVNEKGKKMEIRN